MLNWMERHIWWLLAGYGVLAVVTALLGNWGIALAEAFVLVFWIVAVVAAGSDE